ncbi:MAG TPA: MBL fold metallo-hydrolase [Stellaceae bacterium]|nr:MBL fold metallo-hydrolase [Stellaceae bacterium]
MQGVFQVTLLGTSCPIPLPDRFGPSTLVEAGSQKLLFDAGRGVPIRLWQLRLSMASVNVLFLTHFHSDHTVGIPDVWLTGWLPPAWGHRVKPFHVIGPIGTKDLMSNLERAYALDIKIREADEKLPPEGVAVIAEEFAKDGVAYEKDGVRVTAFEVDHGDLIKPAYGYRVDYDGRSVVISGDTRFNENVIKHGTGSDLMLHEVCIAKPELLKIPAFQRIIDHHTQPEEAGIVFTRAQPRLAAYTHLAPLGTPSIPEPTIADLVAETRKTYRGSLVVGEDLMTFDIGENGVSVFKRGA